MGFGQQIASLFATVGVDTTGFSKGMGGVKKTMTEVGKGLANQILGFATLSGAILAAGAVVVSSVRDWADYADGMRLASQMAGITTEEMSRLVQAADDFRVPMETMQRSMEMALKNGFVPTIENLAALSDRLLAIDDPALRAAEASKIFGKSYADMMPFLLAGGDAIRGATAGIDANLVVTGRAAEEAKAYKDSLDGLQDSWTGLKNLLGQSIAPLVTGIFIGAAEEITLFTKQLLLAKAATEYFNATGGADLGEYIRVMWMALGYEQGSVEELDTELRKLGYSFGTTATAATTTAVAVNSSDLSAARDEYLSTAAVLREDLAGAYDALKTAEDNWRSGVAGQIKVELDEKKNAGQLDTQGYISALETLDSYAGTQYAYEFKISESIPDLVKSLLEDPEGFLGKMSGFEDAMMPLDTSVKTTMENVQLLQEELKKLERVYNGYVNIWIRKSEGTPPAGNGGYGYGGVTPGLRASGGFVGGGTPYIVGERGPELFVPNANGQIIPNNELGGNSDLLGDILLELQNQPSRMKVAIKEAFALVGG